MQLRGEQSHFWWPTSDPRYFWPEDAPPEETLPAFAQVYALHGYRKCDSDALEPGFEKVAIYVDSEDTPTHAARQLPSGRWTSKLGSCVDIEHFLRALEGDHYGSVALIMKRPWRQPEDAGRKP